MGTNVRVCWDYLGWTYPLVASAENVDYPASNLSTGHLRRFWQGSAAAEHTLTLDAGSGLTMSMDTVVIPYASLLVAGTTSVALQRGNNTLTWSDVWTKTPIVTGDLAQPDVLHFVRQESATLTDRAFRLRFYGGMTTAPTVSGGLFLGLATELPVQPTYGRVLGSNRAYRGGDIQMTWPIMTPVQAGTVAGVLASVTPSVAEGFQETLEGVAYGGVPHWLYDPVGTILCLAVAKVPSLFPVTCASPEAATTTAVTPTIETIPPTRWRVRR